MEFHSSQGDLPRIPDDLTIPQFFLDAEHWHELRPAWPKGAPWVVADKSGQGRGLEEVCSSFRYFFTRTSTNWKGGDILATDANEVARCQFARSILDRSEYILLIASVIALF